ncbi:hypothetical protein NK356_20565 [Chryseobacterium sp. S0630]|uniref:hypothetical protein n=1 Tax=Chryseobacterium sp. S0630 TaxID=2957803 RepID=UPI0012E087D0|nr:hypothetical protein [Chryseobacterium sp. S0630]MCP1301578.1 hypothetical protein [Chryseobacterium sp. S0630]
MKRALSIFFLIIFLSTSSIGEQLLKLPELIEHFLLHQEEHDDEASSFIGFLKEHYSYNNSHYNSAKHSHKNLPFKSIDAHAPHIAVFNFQISTFSFLKTIAEIKEKPLYYTNSFIPSAHLKGIWQPPRSC